MEENKSGGVPKKHLIGGGAAVAVVLVVAAIVFATMKKDDLTATTIKIINYVGGVSLSDGSGDLTLRENMLLHSGNVVKTEADGSVDLMLDDTKAAGLDVGSKAAFEQEGKQLKIWIR